MESAWGVIHTNNNVPSQKDGYQTEISRMNQEIVAMRSGAINVARGEGRYTGEWL